MKKALITAIIVGMVLTGCAGAPQPAENSAAAVQQEKVTASAQPLAAGTAPDGAAAPADGQESPASPQMPEVKMVYGEISELVGNAVTVKEIEMPRMGGGGQRFEVPLDENGEPDFSQMELPEGIALDENGRPDFSQMERPEGFTPGEGMPEGFTPGEGGARPNRQGGPGGGAAAGEEREPNYTGEEIEIFIPVGLAVTTPSANDAGVMEMKEIQLDDIKIGDMITVTYKEDGAAIDSVSISQAGASGGMGIPMDAGGEYFFFDVEGGAGARGEVSYEMNVELD